METETKFCRIFKKVAIGLSFPLYIALIVEIIGLFAGWW